MSWINAFIRETIMFCWMVRISWRYALGRWYVWRDVPLWALEIFVGDELPSPTKESIGETAYEMWCDACAELSLRRALLT